MGRWFTLDNLQPPTSKISANKKKKKKLSNKVPGLYNQTFYGYWKKAFAIKYYDGAQ